MAHLGEVEFFTDDGSLFGAAEDTMDFGPRPVPRWASALAVLAALAVASTVATRTSPRHSVATGHAAAVVSPAVIAPVLGRVGPALRGVGGGANALDAVIHRDSLYVLRPGAISVVDLATKHLESMPLTGEYSLRYRSSARLVLDDDADRLWVVATGEHGAQLLEVDLARMAPVRGVTVHFVVLDAAAMGGHLYLATSGGLADLAPGATGTALLPAVDGAVSAVAADPRRHRILVLDASTPGAVVVVSQGRATARRTFGKLIEGTIAVIGDDVWVGGDGGGYHAIVARLDPVTLAPVQTSSVALKVARVIVSPGAHAVWVSTSGPGLWCVDAGNGTILEHWPNAAAPVTSQRGVAYAIDAGSVVPLVLQGCPG